MPNELRWNFVPVPPYGGATAQAWLNTLAASGKSREELIAREALQNSCDAADDKDGTAVRLRLTRRVVAPAELKACEKVLKLKKDVSPRMRKLGLRETNAFDAILGKSNRNVEMLIVEDFHTVGLGGRLQGHLTHNDNFRKLVTHLGVPDKAVGGEVSGGSFGFGKSVYAIASNVHTVLYYSVFEPTEATEGTSARCIIASLCRRPSGIRLRSQ